ncbi:MAG: TetR/AcrR family transcriptional regulator [Candidatus Zixiibacteriota bacterium]
MAGKRIKASQRKQQIIDVATSLFSSHSYEKVTMGMVSAACEITEPALYRHFESKNKLYQEVLRSLSRKVDITELAAQVEHSSDIEEILNLIANHILTNNLKQTELSRLLLYASLERHNLARYVFAAVRMPYIELLTTAFTRLIEADFIRKINPVITARCFVGMVMDCAVSRNLWGNIQGKKFQVKEVLGNNVPIYVLGLRKQ